MKRPDERRAKTDDDTLVRALLARHARAAARAALVRAFDDGPCRACERGRALHLLGVRAAVAL